MSDSSESTSQKNEEPKKDTQYHSFLVHLTIITEVVKKGENGETHCICKNNVSITKENKNNIFVEREIIPEVKVPLIKNDNEKDEATEQKQPEPNSEYKVLSKGLKSQPLQIKLADLCNSLRLLGFPTTGSMINLYMKEVEDYVFFGADPIDSNVYIDSDMVDFNCLRMKIINYFDEKLLKRPKDIKKDDTVKEGSDINNNLNGEDDFDIEIDEDAEEDLKMFNQGVDEQNSTNAKEVGVKHKEKRTKERKIGFIIEKVNAWRKLYNGFYNENGEHTRYSLDQAAKIINISKKSLDDYLLQLRLGRKYGFDFNKNKNERVGVLRVFVKNHRNSDGKDK